MKKLLLLTLGLATGVSVLAQSDYTNANEAAIGTTGALFVVDSNATNYANVTGSGAVWDYSTIAGYGNVTRDIVISDATTHSNASDFTGATHALSIEDFITQFSEVTATEKQMKGFIYNEPTFGELIAKFDVDNALQMTYPFALNSNIDDDFEGSMNYTYQGFPQSNAATGSIAAVYDGNGTLKLEGQDLTDVIRVKTIDTTSFTAIVGQVIFIREQYEYYHFATSNIPVFVHSHVKITGFIDLEFNLVMSSVDPTDATASIEENAKFEEFSLYPNPAVESFNLRFDANKAQKMNVSIINAIGQQIEGRTITSKAGSNKVNINTSDFKKGIYFVTVSNGENKITRKVLVK